MQYSLSVRAALHSERDLGYPLGICFFGRSPGVLFRLYVQVVLNL